jgi:hypothetical protein
VGTGLAIWGKDDALVLGDTLKSMLAAKGISKLGELSVGQGEAIEAFIAA